jgi:uracil permease
MKANYLYDLDDRPPFPYALVYGLQWAFIMFPALIIAATLSVGSLEPGGGDVIRFLRLTLLTSGAFTIIQTLWGHRYPLLEGPASALMLAFILLAPHGIQVIQGGMILGGMLLAALVASRQLERLIRFFTPNVVGVILMLIALGLLRPLLRFMTGEAGAHSNGQGPTFLISLILVLFIAALSHWLKGFWKTVSILIGMILGSLVFLALGRLHWEELVTAPWLSFSTRWLETLPSFSLAAALAFACAYLAVIVNTLGSVQGIAAITEKSRLPKATQRGVFVNGLAGITCGFLGVVGTVSYSMSPGVILVNRVASRYAGPIAAPSC